MECCKNPRDGSPPHAGRIQKSPRGPIKGSNRERKILADATGWHSGPPTRGNKACVFCILEYKHMSDVCDRYLLRAKSTAENQYTSLRSAISDAIHRQRWTEEQISFVTGSRLVNKQDLGKNLKFFIVPEASIQSVYSKLAMRVFDVYANILKCMYSTRYSGG
jgi:hypothetical protein